MMNYSDLSSEQQKFVDLALRGYNILVDACIGSGKTTAIQALCNMLPSTKRVLYLTYNKLLKLDASNKIKNYNVRVQNYHGWAYGELFRNGIRSGVSDILGLYNQSKLFVPPIDVLILDEYQDIEQDIADMLTHIKSFNRGMQIVAVGDMEQKIYDKTTLNVGLFMSQFLGPCYKLEFTQCFRLCAPLAGVLGEIWSKDIKGVNDDCKVSYMTWDEVLEYAQTCDPKDILCLGSSTGGRNWLLNRLEDKCSMKFNKYTVWSKILDNDAGMTQPDSNAGIFTTYDGCKGMERDVCILFDWTTDYWYSRLGKPLVKYEILRNVFCVAASRGKRHIIFCERKKDSPLSKKTLMHNPGDNLNIQDVVMSKMFDFKYAEEIKATYDTLDIREIQPAQGSIDIDAQDGLIDLSPCLGIYQEAMYFRFCNMNRYISLWFDTHPDDKGKWIEGWESWPLESKILYYTSLDTAQNRYLYQVSPDFVPEDAWLQIKSRLSERLSRDEESQMKCEVKFCRNGRYVFSALGFADIVKDDIVYELKFVSELTSVHALQLAMYLVGLDKKVGYLWNVRTNQILEVRVPDVQSFLDHVVRTVTKGLITVYESSEGNFTPEQDKGVVDDARPVSKVVNKKAFNYEQKAIDFVHDHITLCYELSMRQLTHDMTSGSFSPSKVERFFREKGVGMNMSGKTFLKYFGKAMRVNMKSVRLDKQYNVGEFLKKCYPDEAKGL